MPDEEFDGVPKSPLSAHAVLGISDMPSLASTSNRSDTLRIRIRNAAEQRNKKLAVLDGFENPDEFDELC